MDMHLISTIKVSCDTTSNEMDTITVEIMNGGPSKELTEALYIDADNGVKMTNTTPIDVGSVNVGTYTFAPISGKGNLTEGNEYRVYGSDLVYPTQVTC